MKDMIAYGFFVKTDLFIISVKQVYAKIRSDTMGWIS